MAQVYREVTSTKVSDGTANDRVDEYSSTVVARIVYTIGGIIMTILGVRFALSLLGANRANDFASFIYSISHPFVAPFFGLFNYQEQIGVVKFEFETLVAIMFWGFITWLIVRLVTIGSHRNTDVS